MEMSFSNIGFILTDDCNFNCSYCLQRREYKYMRRSTIEKAVAFFYPFLEENSIVVFGGGEPLLAFDNIKYAVSLFSNLKQSDKKNLTYTLTTNGSLLTAETLAFFNSHEFNLMISFDGTSQEITREPGSLEYIQQLLYQFQNGAYPRIKLTTNSVFTPQTIGRLTESLKMIVGYGVNDVQFSLDESVPWDELALTALQKELERLTAFMVPVYKKKGFIPLSQYLPGEQTKRGKIFSCAGGNNRITISAEENIWHCLHFNAYLKGKEGSDEFNTYSLGKLDEFIADYAPPRTRVRKNCRALRQDFFFTENQYCFLCTEVEKCSVCPLYAASATSCIGKIPGWMCRIKKIRSKEKNRFFKIIENINTQKNKSNQEQEVKYDLSGNT